jgi:renalase
MAGLTAARQLARASNQVRVFDKARGAGGRTSTWRHESDAFDHGAQYFTARQDAFVEAVRGWEDAGVIERWPVLDDEQVRYRGTPNMVSLCEHLADGLKVRTKVRITRMTCGADGWELRDSNGDWFGPFESVVVAVPAPQATKLLEPVPELAQRVAAVEMESCWAGMFQFDEPLGPTFDGAFVEREQMSWMARRDGPKGESWVLHSEPGWEPEDALFAGPDGLAVLRATLESAPAHLRDGGQIILEIGLGQDSEVEQLAERSGRYSRPEWRNDYQGTRRVFCAHKV